MHCLNLSMYNSGKLTQLYQLAVQIPLLHFQADGPNSLLTLIGTSCPLINAWYGSRGLKRCSFYSTSQNGSKQIAINYQPDTLSSIVCK